MRTSVNLRPPAWLHRELMYALGAVGSQDALTALIVLAYGNTYLLRVLHTPPSYPAFALGIYGVARVCSAPAAGWLADRAPIAAGALAGALEAGGALLMLATGSATGYFAGLTLISIGTVLAWLLVFRTIGEGSPIEHRAGATAMVGLVSAGTTLAGFGAATLLAELGDWRSPFVAATAIAGVIGVTLAAAGRGRTVPHAAPAPAVAGAPSHLQRQLVAGTVVFLHFSAVSALIVAAGPFVLQLLDLTLLDASILLAPAGVAGAVTMFLVGRRSLHGQRFREAAVLYAMSVIAIVVIVPTSNAVFFAIGMVPLIAALAGTQPLLNAGIVDASRLGEQPGRVLGWLFFAEGLGAVAGPALVGLAIEWHGIRAGVVAVAAVLVLLTLLASAAWRAVRL